MSVGEQVLEQSDLIASTTEMILLCQCGAGNRDLDIRVDKYRNLSQRSLIL